MKSVQFQLSGYPAPLGLMREESVTLCRKSAQLCRPGLHAYKIDKPKVPNKDIERAPVLHQQRLGEPRTYKFNRFI